MQFHSRQNREQRKEKSVILKSAIFSEKLLINLNYMTVKFKDLRDLKRQQISRKHINKLLLKNANRFDYC